MIDFNLNLPCGLSVIVILLGPECKEHANEYFWETHGSDLAGGHARGYDPDFAIAKARAMSAAHVLLRNSSKLLIESM